MKLKLSLRMLSQISPGPTGGVNESRRGFLKVGVGLGVVAMSGPVLALTETTKNAVAAFKSAHPKWSDEFYPFEQDCIDGKVTDKKCEGAVKDQLAMLEDEVKLEASKKQVNARETQVNARETQVNAERVQVSRELEMVNRTTIVTVVLQLNNSIQHGNPDRSGIVALGRINNPILQDDIAFLRSIDAKLTENKVIAKQDITTLKNMLIMHCLVSLKIYNSFTPKQQQEFINTKTIAIGAQKYALKYM